MLGKGRNLCVLEIHRQDAAALGISDGETVEISSDNASLEMPVQLTEDLLPGVVSMPHGFSSDKVLQQSHCQDGRELQSSGCSRNRRSSQRDVCAEWNPGQSEGKAISLGCLEDYTDKATE